MINLVYNAVISVRPDHTMTIIRILRNNKNLHGTSLRRKSHNFTIKIIYKSIASLEGHVCPAILLLFFAAGSSDGLSGDPQPRL